MFKNMRRKDREIFDNEIEDILSKGEYGTLSTISEDGYPYAIPLNYVYFDNSIYFHCAKTGHKVENIENNNKVSFCVVTDTKILPDEFSTKYKSIVAFGTAYNIEDSEKEKALFKLIEKYSPDFIEEGKTYIQKSKDRTKVIKIDINNMTGKSKY